MRITLQQLRELDAGKRQLLAFEKTFGQEVDLTEEVCVRHADTFHWPWMLDTFVSVADFTARGGVVAVEAAEVFNGELIAAAVEQYHLDCAEADTNGDDDGYRKAIADLRYREACAIADKAHNESLAMIFACVSRLS